MNVYFNYGLYTRAVPPGPSVATFRLMIDDVTSDNARGANLDLYDDASEQILGRDVPFLVAIFKRQDSGRAGKEAGKLRDMSLGIGGWGGLKSVDRDKGGARILEIAFFQLNLPPCSQQDFKYPWRFSR
jgi:hypothetical protein